MRLIIFQFYLTKQPLIHCVDTSVLGTYLFPGLRGHLSVALLNNDDKEQTRGSE